MRRVLLTGVPPFEVQDLAGPLEVFSRAAAGVLRGKRVVTHWQWCDDLAQRHPDVKVDRYVIFTKDGNVYTSAGISTGIDLALALVEEDQGRAAALALAKWLVLYVRRTGAQVQLSRLLEAQATWTGRFDRLQEWILEHLPEELNVEKLAAAAGMSPRHFARVFRGEKRVTPARFVERLRVEAAGRMLSESEAGLKEVAAACGFGSADSMARSFARVTGLAPREYARSQQPALKQREQSKRTPTRGAAPSARVPR